jgi:hypothetical protein
MTTDDPDPIAAAAARYKRDEAKAKQSRQGLTELVLEALRQPDAAPTDIARRAEWTAAYVRKLARDNDIHADPSYKARTETARARLLAAASLEATTKSKEPSPAAATPRQQVTETLRKPVPSISWKVLALPLDRITWLVDKAETTSPEWVEGIRQEYPHLQGPDLDYLIVDLGHQKGFKIPELDEPPVTNATGRPVTDEEAATFAARARSLASEMQLKKLDQVEEAAADGSKGFAVMHTALDMVLLKLDEVYGERPTVGEEEGA